MLTEQRIVEIRRYDFHDDCGFYTEEQLKSFYSAMMCERCRRFSDASSNDECPECGGSFAQPP